MKFNSKLVFDIGMHKGEDTAAYLRKGYTVIAVEANPQLAGYCKQKFSGAIQAQQLQILNVGISDKEGVLPFYINLFSSEWSSFDKTTGTRNNTAYEIINVPCVTTRSLFEKYGVPYYMKIDIEGKDYLCLNDIDAAGIKPPYISCEACYLNWLTILKEKGYTRFKLINQANGFKAMNIKQEKEKYYRIYRKLKHSLTIYTDKVFKPAYPFGSSGPFAEETHGPWKTYEEIKNEFEEFMQYGLNIPINNVSWWDFHAAL
jgi:FkbM family methyltransferase